MYYLENDYELLYLIKQNHDEALEFIYRKYDNLIKTRIRGFRIKSKNYEDFYQEGLLMLQRAIETYDDKYGKSFNKYFDLILQRRFMQLLHQERKHFYDTVYVEEFYDVVEESRTAYKIIYEETVAEIRKQLSEFEKKVFFYQIQQGLKSAEVAEILNCNVRRVYNAMLRIKQKIK